MEFNTKTFLFIFSIAFFLLSQIFLLVQGIKNYEFFKFDDDKIIVEKTLFEQFSLNTYYNCRNIYSSELKKNCQNSIISNNTDCTPYSSNSDYDYDINYEERLNYDGRIKYCQYFSRFTQKISKIFKNYMCRDSTVYTYEDLLFNSMALKDINGIYNYCPNNLKKCGILDTKNNILCISEYYDCPYNVLQSSSGGGILPYEFNDKKIITSIIISENQPMNHEWDTYVREVYEDIDEEDKIKRRSLTTKDFELIGDKEDNTYSRQEVNYKVEDILSNNKVNNIQTSQLNSNQNLYIYTRNYIGFKDYDELLNFKKIFNENDPMDNPLFKLASSGHNPIITIFFSLVFIVLAILAFVFGVIKFNSQGNNYNKIIKSFFIVNCVFFVVELFIIAFHFAKYPKIHIDMDERMKKVLDLYNDRTFATQVYRIISLVFSVVSFTPIIIKFFKKEDSIHND